MDAADDITALLQSISAEFSVAMGRPERVASVCSRIREKQSSPLSGADLAPLLELAPLLRLKTGAIASPIFDLLEEAAASCPEPWSLIEGMLAARDAVLARRALALAARLAETRRVAVDRRAAAFLAERVEAEGSPLAEADPLRDIARILRLAPRGKGTSADPLVDLFLREEDTRIRRLAARLLDLDGQPAPSEMAEAALGLEACAFLRPYLAYTRATHLDLLHLAPVPGIAPPVVPSLRRAEAICGETLLREVIADLGWARVNHAVEASPFAAVSIEGAFPVMVLTPEAALLESHEGARRISESFLIVARGGIASEERDRGGARDSVARFRAYNLAHAEALAEILDVVPLTREKVERILDRMDRIVADFGALFAPWCEECSILPGIYDDLKRRIIAEMEKGSPAPHLSAEVTRLVQSFEDPGSIGAVRTLHGLKRHLHQRGLRLGFRLVEISRATNRTVSLVAASRDRPLRSAKGIHYVDFEPDMASPEGAGRLPYPVAVVVDGFSRQLLHGIEKLPSVRVFCYGNEVHYYIAYGNHPAFLRIDYAPPLQGGMIDLEYYGVSKYELSAHPDPSLEAIRAFFRALEFDVQIDNTHIHARYDKERAIELGDLCEKAEALFRLVPYLMELDWIIGSLDLDTEARREVAEAWAERFASWGVLPIAQMLTKDRLRILERVEAGPAGEREIAWSGAGPYRDRFTAPSAPNPLARLRESLEKTGIDLPPPLSGEHRGLALQISLDRHLLRPLREAVDRGEIVVTQEGVRRSPVEIFRREDEAEAFARILGSGDEAIASSALLAQTVAPIERSVRFRTTGAVNSYPVQRTRLTLRGESLGLYVLRDAMGIVRLALFSRGEGLLSRRGSGEEPWQFSGSTDAVDLARLLRLSSYIAPGPAPSLDDARGETSSLRALFAQSSAIRAERWRPGERVVTGLRASPGRSAGRAILGTTGRTPADLDGAILVSPHVRPADTTFLYHAAGIVSTGGGVLSHAGLIAAQFRKPALIIAGRWERGSGGPPCLACGILEYREEEKEVGAFRVSVRREMREREIRLREGDLVVLDADEGALRILGQDREALALHEGFRLYAEAVRRTASAAGDKEILVLRGRRLRARHQIEKLLSRITDPALARHAIRELLLGDVIPAEAAARAEGARLLSLLLENDRAGAAAREQILEMVEEMRLRRRALRDNARARIPSSTSLHELLALRLDVIHLDQMIEGAAASLRGCGIDMPPVDPFDIDAPARRRLEEMRADRARAIAEAASTADGRALLRHLLHQIERIDLVIGAPPEGRGSPDPIAASIACEDDSARVRLASKRVLTPGEGGFEIFESIGWKAANLAEVDRLAGSGRVPPWFVVAHRAFEETLDVSVEGIAPIPGRPASGGVTLREAIDAVLDRADLDAAAKSAQIRDLWETVTLPRDLAGEVASAYRRLGETAPSSPDQPGERSRPFVAIRSSAREEDAEVAARAGEFDTFLFVRPEDQVLLHLKRAWSGLWTERAIHNRAVLGSPAGRIGGGVIVQRMVRSRVSGVLQTINAAEGELREMVINAGLGLGEGVVSGTVAADHIVVAKEGDLERGPLRFRYITADKREQVVLNRREGAGTMRVETLYHQRLRPALEYTDLLDLVGVAGRLEAAYGYPLDIEFGIEGSRLFILQVRPVPALLPKLRETLERHPLARAGPSPTHPTSMEIIR